MDTRKYQHVIDRGRRSLPRNGTRLCTGNGEAMDPLTRWKLAVARCVLTRIWVQL